METLLSHVRDMRFSGHCNNLADALPILSEIQPDVAMLGLPPFSDALPVLVANWKITSPNTRIILWTDDRGLTSSTSLLPMGLSAVIRQMCSDETLLDCLRTVSRGQTWVENALPARNLAAYQRLRITTREREVIGKVRLGLKNREIAEALQITTATVKAHLMHIFEKTGAANRSELADRAQRLLGDPEAS